MTIVEGSPGMMGSNSTRIPSKSYLGQTLEERRSSHARKAAIKESLGVFLSTTDMTGVAPNPAAHGHYQSAPKPTLRKQLPVDNPKGPRRTSSGGSILSAMTTKAWSAPSTGRRKSTSDGQHSRGGKTISASAMLDDPFIDALLGSSQVEKTPQSISSKKQWQGLGLDQFKDIMGYRKAPVSQGEGSSSSQHMGQNRNNLHAREKEVDGSEGVHLAMKRRSKSPSFLRRRLKATPDSVSVSERSHRSVDKSQCISYSSSMHTRSTANLSESSPSLSTSRSERGPRSIETRRKAPPRSISDCRPRREGRGTSIGGHSNMCTPSSTLILQDDYTTTSKQHYEGATLSVDSSVSEIDYNDNVIGLEFEADLAGSTDEEEVTHHSRSPSRRRKIRSMSSSTRSSRSCGVIRDNSSSHGRRSRGSRSRSPHSFDTSPLSNTSNPRSANNSIRLKIKAKNPASPGGRPHTPSSHHRKTIHDNVRVSPRTPSSISSTHRRSVQLESAEGWGDLSFQDMDADFEEELVTAESDYAHDARTAMRVGSHLMDLGVRLLARGHDLKTAARRNSVSGDGSSRANSTKLPAESSESSIRRSRRAAITIPTVVYNQDSSDESDIESLGGFPQEQDRAQYAARRSRHQKDPGNSTNDLDDGGGGASMSSSLDLEQLDDDKGTNREANGCSNRSLGMSSTIRTSFNSLMDIDSNCSMANSMYEFGGEEVGTDRGDDEEDFTSLYDAAFQGHPEDENGLLQYDLQDKHSSIQSCLDAWDEKLNITETTKSSAAGNVSHPTTNCSVKACEESMRALLKDHSQDFRDGLKNFNNDPDDTNLSTKSCNDIVWDDSNASCKLKDDAGHETDKRSDSNDSWTGLEFDFSDLDPAASAAARRHPDKTKKVKERRVRRSKSDHANGSGTLRKGKKGVPRQPVKKEGKV